VVANPGRLPIESSKVDVRYSTLDRYVEAVTKHTRRLDLTPA
jgi:hypothetical protein